MTLHVLDLFSGIGGFSLGLERTGGFKTVAFCEIEKYPQQILKQHWPEVPIYNDVKTLTAEQLRADGITVDVICGGFPCQDISVAGRGAGLAGEQSGLWFEFHRLIEEIRPSWVIAENVSALRSRGLDQVLRSLSEIGYDAEWHCIPASAIGAPHRRDRVWIVAYPNNDGWASGTRPSFACGNEQNPRRSQKQKSTFQFMGSNSQPLLSTNVAYPAGAGLSERGQPRQPASHTEARAGVVTELERRSEIVADTQCFGQPGSWTSWNASNSTQVGKRQTVKSLNGGFGHQWAVEPDVGRVAHGVPKRVDRLKALGNAVVPQIPQIIGEAILASAP